METEAAEADPISGGLSGRELKRAGLNVLGHEHDHRHLAVALGRGAQRLRRDVPGLDTSEG
jgi:hypothetical protein